MASKMAKRQDCFGRFTGNLNSHSRIYAVVFFLRSRGDDVQKFPDRELSAPLWAKDKSYSVLRFDCAIHLPS